MDREAVLLSWGKPNSIERVDTDHSKGVDQQIWMYRRGPQTRDDYRLTIVEDRVTLVEKP